ncbi:MAG: polyprenyl synthetase family protein, partial [Helicobacter sp.]|nr:polyprenyl synthetase family protein [Helicobacter sp.]
MVQNGGKRFRPRLLFATILALDSQRFAQKKGIFQAALALECLHTYSLIHDDLPCMD